MTIRLISESEMIVKAVCIRCLIVTVVLIICVKLLMHLLYSIALAQFIIPLYVHIVTISVIVLRF